MPGEVVRPWEAAEDGAAHGRQALHSQDGKTPRGHDDRVCKHGTNVTCDYCMLLEPYDPEHHTKNNIKDVVQQQMM